MGTCLTRRKQHQATPNRVHTPPMHVGGPDSCHHEHAGLVEHLSIVVAGQSYKANPLKNGSQPVSHPLQATHGGDLRTLFAIQ